jgi:hypothetical protein
MLICRRVDALDTCPIRDRLVIPLDDQVAVPRGLPTNEAAPTPLAETVVELPVPLVKEAEPAPLPDKVVIAFDCPTNEPVPVPALATEPIPKAGKTNLVSRRFRAA